MKNVKKKLSVLPLYLVAVVWLVGGIVFKVHRPIGFIILAIISVAILGFGFELFPTSNVLTGTKRGKARTKARTSERPKPEPERRETAVEPTSHVRPVSIDPEVLELRDEKDKMIRKMHRYSDEIQSVKIQDQVGRIEKTTSKIYAHVITHPEKKRQVRRFQNYYMPTALKLLESCARMTATRPDDPRVKQAQGKIVELMGSIADSFDHLLDAMYQDQILDLATESKALEQILNS